MVWSLHFIQVQDATWSVMGWGFQKTDSDLRWRLAGKRPIREGFWGQYPGQKEEDPEKEMSCQPVPMDTSPDLAGSSEAGMTLQICH